MSSTRPVLTIESFEDRVLPSAFGLSGFGAMDFANPLPVSQSFRASGAIGGALTQEASSPISLNQQLNSPSNAVPVAQGAEFNSPISLDRPWSEQNTAASGSLVQGVLSTGSPTPQAYHQSDAASGEVVVAVITPLSLNQQFYRQTEASVGLLGQDSSSVILLTHPAVSGVSVSDWSGNPRVEFPTELASSFDYNFQGSGNFNVPSVAIPMWLKLGAVGVAGTDAPAQSQSSGASSSTQPASETNTSPTIPGLLIVTQSPQVGSSQPPGSEQLLGSESHVLADLKLQAIPLTGNQQAFSGLQSAATIVFGNYSTTLATDLLPRATAIQSSLNLNAPVTLQPITVLDSLRSVVSPIAIAGPVDTLAGGVVNLDSAKLDANLNRMLGSMTTLGLELTEEVEQPELYTYYIAAGLLGLGSVYVVWINNSSRPRKRLPLARRDNTLWCGENL